MHYSYSFVNKFLVKAEWISNKYFITLEIYFKWEIDSILVQLSITSWASDRM